MLCPFGGFVAATSALGPFEGLVAATPALGPFKGLVAATPVPSPFGGFVAATSALGPFGGFVAATPGLSSWQDVAAATPVLCLFGGFVAATSALGSLVVWGLCSSYLSAQFLTGSPRSSSPITSLVSAFVTALEAKASQQLDSNPMESGSGPAPFSEAGTGQSLLWDRDSAGISGCYSSLDLIPLETHVSHNPIIPLRLPGEWTVYA